jgi:hypothetical protein
VPNRIIKESICVSDSIDQLNWFEEVLFYRLIVSCDDYGRYDGRPAIIKNRLFPLKDNLTIKAVSEAIKKLASAELVTLYEYEGKPYLYLPTWNEHQTIRAKKSKYPSPEDGVISSEIICKQMNSNDSKCPRNPIQSNTKSESNAESECGGRNSSRFAPPTLEDVEAYCRERNNRVDAQRFFDYYTSNGWKVGKNPMKDWKAAVRTWERSDSQPAPFKEKRILTFMDL